MFPSDHNNPPSDADLMKEKIAPSVAAFLKTIDELKTKSEKLKDRAIDEKNYDRALKFIALIKTTGKNIETSRKSYKDDVTATGNVIQADFKPLKEAIETLVATESKKMIPHLKFLAEEEEKENKKKLEAARAREEEAQAAIKKAEDEGILERFPFILLWLTFLEIGVH